MMNLAVFFVACHLGSADHMAIFAEVLQKRGVGVTVLATKTAAQKFSSNVEIFAIEELDALVEKCSHASHILTDVGNSFSADFLQAIEKKAPQVFRMAYTHSNSRIGF